MPAPGRARHACIRYPARRTRRGNLGHRSCAVAACNVGCDRRRSGGRGCGREPGRGHRAGAADPGGTHRVRLRGRAAGHLRRPALQPGGKIQAVACAGAAARSRTQPRNARRRRIDAARVDATRYGGRCLGPPGRTLPHAARSARQAERPDAGRLFGAPGRPAVEPLARPRPRYLRCALLAPAPYSRPSTFLPWRNATSTGMSRFCSRSRSAPSCGPITPLESTRLLTPS